MSLFGWGKSEDKAVSSSDEGVSQTIEIDASIAECIKVISDYEQYPQFLDNIKYSKIVREKSNFDDHENAKDVHYKMQSGITSAEYTLCCWHTDDTVHWKHTDHGPFSVNTGGWTFKILEKDAEGKETKVEATYTVNIQFNVWVPSFLKNYLVGSSLPATLNAFKDRIHASKASPVQ